MKDKLLVLLLCVSVLCDFTEAAGPPLHHLPPTNAGAAAGLRVTRTSGGYPYNLRNNNSQTSNATKGSVSSATFVPFKGGASTINKTSSGQRSR